LATVSVDFYKAVASLLPVLALAAVVEFSAMGRRLHLQPTPFIWLFLANLAVVFSAVICGEVLALDAVAGGSLTKLREGIVRVVLFFATTILIGNVGSLAVAELDARSSRPVAAALGVLWAVLVLVGSLLAGFA
jgi:hypothetical protein